MESLINAIKGDPLIPKTGGVNNFVYSLSMAIIRLIPFEILC